MTKSRSAFKTGPISWKPTWDPSLCLVPSANPRCATRPARQRRNIHARSPWNIMAADGLTDTSTAAAAATLANTRRKTKHSCTGKCFAWASRRFYFTPNIGFLYHLFDGIPCLILIFLTCNLSLIIHLFQLCIRIFREVFCLISRF